MNHSAPHQLLRDVLKNINSCDIQWDNLFYLDLISLDLLIKTDV